MRSYVHEFWRRWVLLKADTNELSKKMSPIKLSMQFLGVHLRLVNEDLFPTLKAYWLTYDESIQIKELSKLAEIAKWRSYKGQGCVGLLIRSVIN